MQAKFGNIPTIKLAAADMPRWAYPVVRLTTL